MPRLLGGKAQRRFISAVTELWGSRHGLFGLAVFDGSIRAVDVQTCQPVLHYREHRGRTWAIENLRDNLFASCGDDGTVRLWDPRMGSSVHTISGQRGRVSQLLLLNENCFVSACCDDEAQHGGELSFWDPRVFA